MDWEKGKKIKYIASELPLISEKHRFGGMLDIYAAINDKLTLLDLKTCKAIYDEMKTQVGGGYLILLEENNMPVDESRILRIGRSETEGFEDVLIDRIALHKKRILLCRELYELNKEINRK